jgi:hypothetical protein
MELKVVLEEITTEFTGRFTEHNEEFEAKFQNTQVVSVPTETSVLYTEQDLSDEEKAQARENIGALSETEVTVVLEQAKESGLFDGKDGEDGHTPVKGVDYFDGENGNDGVSPTVSVSKSGKVTTITINDVVGTEIATVNDGKDGEDGYTPIKGTDYFTEADKQEMIASVIASLPVYDGTVVAE